MDHAIKCYEWEVFDRLRALPRCTDVIGVISSSQCCEPVSIDDVISREFTVFDIVLDLKFLQYPSDITAILFHRDGLQCVLRSYDSRARTWSGL